MIESPVKQKKFRLPISPEERDLIFCIIDGNKQALTWIYMFRSMWHTAAQVPYLESLAWLKKNKITGLKFVNWMKEKHDNSPVNAIAYLRQVVFKDHKKRTVFARGRNGFR